LHFNHGNETLRAQPQITIPQFEELGIDSVAFRKTYRLSLSQGIAPDGVEKDLVPLAGHLSPSVRDPKKEKKMVNHKSGIKRYGTLHIAPSHHFLPSNERLGKG
jgi:hypothetical protein